MFGRFRRNSEHGSRGNEDVIGFAFSGGGTRAATQVGALKALIEADIRPQLVAGTSAGAVNATWFALYPQRLDRLESIWRSLRTRDVFPGGRVRVLINLAKNGYVHSALEWEHFLRREVGNARFEDCIIPCAVVAVRLSDGERVVFDSGEIVPAIMASTAIPGVFPPYRIGDELYADGGVLEYMPIPTLLERGATSIYAMDCSWIVPGADFPESVLDRCSRIGARASVDRMCSLPEARGHKIHLLRPEIPQIKDSRHFSHTDDLLRAGYDQAYQYLQAQAEPGHPSARPTAAASPAS
jgi:NTE family protein